MRRPFRTSFGINLATRRKHGRQLASPQINGLRAQSAVTCDPPSHAIGIMCPQIFGARFVGLRTEEARVPGGVEGEHGPRRHANTIARGIMLTTSVHADAQVPSITTRWPDFRNASNLLK